MDDFAIKVENLSKAYQLGDFSTGTLNRDLERWWALMRGKEDPFLKIGETNDRTVKGESDIIWSLKDINFEIKPGDAVGIIGRNGAGKSTLLKVLSRVTSPTTGLIKVKGRIASLLEVGTGFHPDLTGRENVYLNGAILGMRKAEIKKQFDAIVDFAGIERYIDTPVKRYSSGMYVRLAFAVAAHLESEILVVDEVLAVGDAEFQKKCLGKMNDISKGEGRTILFVSHNMGAILDLCTSAILLTNGTVAASGSADAVIQTYLNINSNSKTQWTSSIKADSPACFTKVFLSDAQGKLMHIMDNRDSTYLNIEVHISDVQLTGTIAFEVKSIQNVSIFCSHDYDAIPMKYYKGLNKFKVKLPQFLRAGFYYINVGINSRGFSSLDFVETVISFEVIGIAEGTKPLQDNRPGLLYFPLQWEA